MLTYGKCKANRKTKIRVHYKMNKIFRLLNDLYTKWFDVLCTNGQNHIFIWHNRQHSYRIQIHFIFFLFFGNFIIIFPYAFNFIIAILMENLNVHSNSIAKLPKCNSDSFDKHPLMNSLTHTNAYVWCKCFKWIWKRRKCNNYVFTHNIKCVWKVFLSLSLFLCRSHFDSNAMEKNKIQWIENETMNIYIYIIC